MNRWIVASSEPELALIRKAADARPAGNADGFPSYIGTLNGEPIGLGIVGVGIVSAALAIGGFLATGEVSQMIMVGSAGAFPGSELDAGDVAIASSETLAELGVCAGRGLGDATALSFLGLEQTLTLDERLAREMAHAGEGTFFVRTGPFLSVTGVSDSEEQAAARAARFQTLVENMEGYALALAGQRAGVPVVEVRGVSNRAGIRDKATWNLELANARAQEVVLAFCRQHGALKRNSEKASGEGPF
jgi:futalosine hydrolase